jgi:hypothetical protein
VQVTDEGIESGTASLEGVREGARERGMVVVMVTFIYVTRIARFVSAQQDGLQYSTARVQGSCYYGIACLRLITAK